MKKRMTKGVEAREGRCGIECFVRNFIFYYGSEVVGVVVWGVSTVFFGCWKEFCAGVSL